MTNRSHRLKAEHKIGIGELCSPLLSFPKKPAPAWPQVADPLVPNRILRLLNFREKERGGSFLFSKACKSLYRRRFKEIEGAPLAAYEYVLQESQNQ
jgi:hypothetical protein